MGGINPDFIIVVVYFTCLAIIVVQAIQSLENQVTVKLDQATLQEQLERLHLGDRLAIEFPLRPYYGFEPLSTLTLVLANKTAADLLYVDWDQCTIADQSKQARRAVRLVPGSALDLSQPQTYTIVPPGQQVKEQLTTEAALQRDPKNSPNPLQTAAPVVNLAIAQKLSGGGSTTFSVWLTLGFSPLERSVRPMQDLQTVRCLFTIQRAHWIQRVPVARFIQQLVPGQPWAIGKVSTNGWGWLLIIGIVVLLLLSVSQFLR